MIGPHCPANLPTRATPYCVRLSNSFDEDGYEQGQRINGFDCCPQCGLWWPCIEEPDCWEEDDSRWKATGWWGASVCEDCGLLMIEQPDGRGECYQLRADN